MIVIMCCDKSCKISNNAIIITIVILTVVVVDLLGLNNAPNSCVYGRFVSLFCRHETKHLLQL